MVNRKSKDDEENSVTELEPEDEYEYESESDTSNTYSGISTTFDVQVENNQYKIHRLDSVPNPGHELTVETAKVIGDTLVVKENFADRTDDNIVSASVVSNGGYSETWTIDAEINTVAVEHPYNDHPYVKQI